MGHRFPADPFCGRDRRRSGDLPLFRRPLCQLSYPTPTKILIIREFVAVPTGFEPATSALTGRRALQTAPRDRILNKSYFVKDHHKAIFGSKNRMTLYAIKLNKPI